MQKHIWHPIEKSPLYSLYSKKRLAKLFNIQLADLVILLKHPKAYQERMGVDAKGKKRFYQSPLGKLRLLQKQLHRLLICIEPPYYLSSPAIGRSNITNAKLHINGKVIRTLDIKTFFPSTRSSNVFRFFREDLKCSPDVSGLLTEICVKDGYLPTGAPTSPIMAFYAYKPMWEEIRKLCEANGCIFSIIVDDLTISGDDVSKELIGEIKKIIHHYSLRHHPRKEKIYKTNQFKNVTGVIITPKGELILPNRLHKKRHDYIKEQRKIKSLEKKSKFTEKIKGLDNYHRQIQLTEQDLIPPGEAEQY